MANSTISVHIYHLSGKKYKHTYEYIKRGPFANELPGGPNVILPIHEKCASAQVKAWICSRKIMQRNLMEKKRGYLQADLFRLSVMHCSVFHSVRPAKWDQSKEVSHTPQSSVQTKAQPILVFLAYDLMDSRCTDNATELYSSSMCICFIGFSEASIQEKAEVLRAESSLRTKYLCSSRCSN